MDTFLERHELPKLKKKKILFSECSPIAIREIELVIETSPKRKFRPRWFHWKMLPKSKEEITPIIPRLFWKIEEEGIFLNSFYEASLILIPKPDNNITESTD